MCDRFRSSSQLAVGPDNPPSPSITPPASLEDLEGGRCIIDDEAGGEEHTNLTAVTDDDDAISSDVPTSQTLSTDGRSLYEPSQTGSQSDDDMSTHRTSECERLSEAHKGHVSDSDDPDEVDLLCDDPSARVWRSRTVSPTFMDDEQRLEYKRLSSAREKDLRALLRALGTKPRTTLTGDANVVSDKICSGPLKSKLPQLWREYTHNYPEASSFTVPEPGTDEHQFASCVPTWDVTSTITSLHGCLASRCLVAAQAPRVSSTVGALQWRTGPLVPARLHLGVLSARLRTLPVCARERRALAGEGAAHAQQRALWRWRQARRDPRLVGGSHETCRSQVGATFGQPDARGALSGHGRCVCSLCTEVRAALGKTVR